MAIKIKKYKYDKGIQLQKKNPFERLEEVREFGAPQYIFVPLKQYKGQPPIIMVAEGDSVSTGSVLAKGRTSTIYSPVTGKVAGFQKRPSVFGGMCNHVVIETSAEENIKTFPQLDMEQLTPEIIIKRVFDAGIVNNEGTPLYQKLILKDDHATKYLVVNACTDELFFTGNVTMLNTKAVEVISGAIYLANCLKVTSIKLVVTESMTSKITPFLETLGEYDGEFSIEVASVTERYPVGDERELAYSILGRELSAGKTALDEGIPIVDIDCCYSVYEALVENMPDTKRLLTVVGSGENGKSIENIWVKIGTSISDIITVVRPEGDESVKQIIAGGPMRGIAVAGPECAITKNIKGIMLLGDDALSKPQELPCIGCGKCASACPRKMLPYKIDEFTLNMDFKNAKKFGAEFCTKCGCCEYVCPAKRRLVQRISFAKRKIEDKEI